MAADLSALPWVDENQKFTTVMTPVVRAPIR